MFTVFHALKLRETIIEIRSLKKSIGKHPNGNNFAI